MTSHLSSFISSVPDILYSPVGYSDAGLEPHGDPPPGVFMLENGLGVVAADISGCFSTASSGCDSFAMASFFALEGAKYDLRPILSRGSAGALELCRVVLEIGRYVVSDVERESLG